MARVSGEETEELVNSLRKVKSNLATIWLRTYAFSAIAIRSFKFAVVAATLPARKSHFSTNFMMLQNARKTSAILAKVMPSLKNKARARTCDLDCQFAFRNQGFGCLRRKGRNAFRRVYGL